MSDTIAVRLFAWMVTITALIYLFRIGNWMFYEFVIPVVDFFGVKGALYRIIEIILFIIPIILICIIAGFIFKWILRMFDKEKIAYTWSIVGCGVLTIFYAYICFAPYFYTEDYLKQVGIERVYDLAALTSDEFTADERIDMAKKTMTMGEARQMATEQMGYPLRNVEITEIDVIDFERSFNTYSYTVRVAQQSRGEPGQELSVWTIEIKPGFFTFLVEGYSMR